ncbi:MAG: PepSY domain-containing protein [Allosphingosinicella sp.]|uniref:PepSY domain-containing protein n=1 Tax=Allosphingosinicella sp. TaxID=2823234 RepID=UPI00392B8DDA
MSPRFRWSRLVRGTHKWLGLLLGLQALIWAVTGLYMVAVHIDHVRGNHLVRHEPAAPFDLDALAPPGTIAALHPNATEIRLHRLFGVPAWRVDGPDGAFLADGRSGARLPHLDAAAVRRRARDVYAGEGEIVAVRLLTEAPLEVQSRKPPFWQVEFEGWSRPTLYFSPTTGELLSRRHAAWRVFDFAWMLHIMDYESRTDTNNRLLRAATVASVPLALSGAWLLLWTLPRRWRRRRGA